MILQLLPFSACFGPLGQKTSYSGYSKWKATASPKISLASSNISCGKVYSASLYTLKWKREQNEKLVPSHHFVSTWKEVSRKLKLQEIPHNLATCNSLCRTSYLSLCHLNTDEHWHGNFCRHFINHGVGNGTMTPWDLNPRFTHEHGPRYGVRQS